MFRRDDKVVRANYDVYTVSETDAHMSMSVIERTCYALSPTRERDSVAYVRPPIAKSP